MVLPRPEQGGGIKSPLPGEDAGVERCRGGSVFSLTTASVPPSVVILDWFSCWKTAFDPLYFLLLKEKVLDKLEWAFKGLWRGDSEPRAWSQSLAAFAFTGQFGSAFSCSCSVLQVLFPILLLFLPVKYRESYYLNIQWKQLNNPAGKIFDLLWFIIIVRPSSLGACWRKKTPLHAVPALSRVNLQ